jgi:hypothetical protein
MPGEDLFRRQNTLPSRECFEHPSSRFRIDIAGERGLARSQRRSLFRAISAPFIHELKSFENGPNLSWKAKAN